MRAQDFRESVSSCIGKSLIRICLLFILNSKSTTATSPPLILNKIISNFKSNHWQRVGKSKNTTLSGFQIAASFCFLDLATKLAIASCMCNCPQLKCAFCDFRQSSALSPLFQIPCCLLRSEYFIFLLYQNRTMKYQF